MNRKYEISTKENREFLKASCEDLLNFGHRFPSPNGGSYYLGDDGTPWKDRNRETWITCRMAHVYSLGLMLGHEGSGELVDAALKGLKGELHDDKNGGWYAGVTPEGDFNSQPHKEADSNFRQKHIYPKLIFLLIIHISLIFYSNHHILNYFSCKLYVFPGANVLEYFCELTFRTIILKYL